MAGTTGKARLLRGPPASLASDEFVALVGLADYHRLDHPDRCDRGSELVERGGVEDSAGLPRIAADSGDGKFHDARRGVGRGRRRRLPPVDVCLAALFSQ